MSHHDMNSQIAYALVKPALEPWESGAYERAAAVRESLKEEKADFTGAVKSGVRRAGYICGGAVAGFVWGLGVSKAFDLPEVFTSICFAVSGGVFGNYAASRNHEGYRFSEVPRLLERVSGLETQLKSIEGSADYKNAVEKVSDRALML